MFTKQRGYSGDRRAVQRSGLSGCIGCVDCAGWKWDNCPVGWQGQYIGKDKKPVCRMEVLCHDGLRIWHIMFGIPGAKNDQPIVSQSSLFNAIRTGSWPPFRPEVNVSGLTVKCFYLLVDGIYPKYKIFAKPISEPKTESERCYAKRHNSARNCRTCI